MLRSWAKPKPHSCEFWHLCVQEIYVLLPMTTVSAAVLKYKRTTLVKVSFHFSLTIISLKIIKETFHGTSSVLFLSFVVTTVVALVRCQRKMQGYFQGSEEAVLSVSTENLALVLIQVCWGSRHWLPGDDKDQTSHHTLSSCVLRLQCYSETVIIMFGPTYWSACCEVILYLASFWKGTIMKK